MSESSNRKENSSIKNLLIFTCCFPLFYSLGEETRRLLSDISAADRTVFFSDVKTIYHAIAEYLKTRLPLKNKFLRDMEVLDPSMKTDPNSTDKMIRVARAIPGLLTGMEIDLIRGEWMMYANETIDESFYVKNRYHDTDGNVRIEYHRIDVYWSKIFSMTTNVGLPKYPTMTKVIKNALIISHGNSDVERGFSTNEHIVTENRTHLSASSINGIRATWDAVNFLGFGSSHKVPIKAEMISAVQKSKSTYNQEQLLQKAAAKQANKDNDVQTDADQETRKLIDEEHRWLSKQKDLQAEQKRAQCLISEGRQRLDDALKKADVLEAQAANALIGAGDEQVKSICEEMKKVTDELLKIQSKRKNAFAHGNSADKKKQKTTTATDD